MNGTLLLSKRTCSLSTCKSVIEWKEIPLDIKDFHLPADFELKLVNAELQSIDDVNESILDKFSDQIRLRWDIKNYISSTAIGILPHNRGLTDIAWYIEELKIAYVIRSFARMPEFMMFKSVNSLKDALKRGLHSA